MIAEANTQLKDDVAAWAAETRVLIAACRCLVEYFGTEDELRSWDAALVTPLDWVATVLARVPPGPGGQPPFAPNPAIVPFQCSEATARVISPLAEIVGGPVADFVYTIREEIAAAEQDEYLRPYGHFSAAFADAVTGPIWR